MRKIKFADLYCETAFKDVHEDIVRNKQFSEYWLKGGRGSTKSCFVSLEIVTGMMLDTSACAIIYRRVGNTLKDSVYEQIIWAIDTLGISHAFQYRKSPLEIIRTKTGQRIMFRGADDPAKSKSIRLKQGMYFRYLWFEELAEFRSMEDIRTIKQSVFRGVDHAITFYSYNPPKTAHSWVNEEALKHTDGRMVNHSSYTQVPEAWLGERFLAEAETLKRTNELAYRNEYLGEVTGTGGSVFNNVIIRDITDDELDTLDYFYQGIDWGYFPDPFQWVRCAYDPARRKLYIIDEYRVNKASNYDAYTAIEQCLDVNEPLIADSAEMKSISDFRNYGAYWCQPVKKGAGSVAYSMKWLASLSEIIIDSKCQYCAKEFSCYEYERNRNGEFVNAYVDAENHGIDAVRYAMSPVWRRAGD